MAKEPPPICLYCGKPSKLTSGAVIYPRRPDLRDKPIWACMPCGAWVGCHPFGTKPLGRLADKELRDAKMRAHSAFDPLWREKAYRASIGKGRARRQAYHWLADALSISFENCHIGMFDVATCDRVVEICSKYYPGSAGRTL